MDNQIIASKLRDARKNVGLTQKEVADKLGVTFQAISNYERGVNKIEASTLYRLCELYGISTASILSGTNHPDFTFHLFLQIYKEELEEYFAHSLSKTSEDESRLLSSYRSLNSEGKVKALDHIEDLAAIDKYKNSNMSQMVEKNA